MDILRPRIIGIIMDIGNFLFLDRIRSALIGSISRLESATEDKVYLYRPGGDRMNGWVAQSIAEVAGCRAMVRVDPEAAIRQTVETLLDADPEDDKHIVYLTDRFSSEQYRRAERALIVEGRADTRCRFTLVGVGGAYSRSLADLTSSHPRCRFRHLDMGDLTLATFEEIIDHGSDDIRAGADLADA